MVLFSTGLFLERGREGDSRGRERQTETDRQRERQTDRGEAETDRQRETRLLTHSLTHSLMLADCTLLITIDSTGSFLRMFVSGLCAPGTVVALRQFLVAAQADRGAICFWNWAQDKPVIKIPIMEKVTGLACTSDAQFCIAGTDQGTLLVWQVSCCRALYAFVCVYVCVSVCLCVCVCRLCCSLVRCQCIGIGGL